MDRVGRLSLQKRPRQRDSPALAWILYQSESQTEERDSHIVRGSVMVGTSVHAILEMSTIYQANSSDADYGAKLQQKWRDLRNRCGGLVYHWNSCPDLEDQTKERNYRQICDRLRLPCFAGDSRRR